MRTEQFSPKEAALLRRCYSGLEPRTFSRYGVRQWAAPLPWMRIVIKDPFAVLSLAAIHGVTGARPILIYRHPAAVLASYRRMGWTADAAEMAALGAPASDDESDVTAMAVMWGWCHEIALGDLEGVPGALVVSHTSLTMGGAAALGHLRALLGLSPISEDSPQAGPDAGNDAERREGVLHDFNRTSSEVDVGWRQHLSAEDISAVEVASAPIWRALEARQLHFPTVVPRSKDAKK